jgi:hypothetical protein
MTTPDPSRSETATDDYAPRLVAQLKREAFLLQKVAEQQDGRLYATRQKKRLATLMALAAAYIEHPARQRPQETP